MSRWINDILSADSNDFKNKILIDNNIYKALNLSLEKYNTNQSIISCFRSVQMMLVYLIYLIEIREIIGQPTKQIERGVKYEMVNRAIFDIVKLYNLKELFTYIGEPNFDSNGRTRIIQPLVIVNLLTLYYNLQIPGYKIKEVIDGLNISIDNYGQNDIDVFKAIKELSYDGDGQDNNRENILYISLVSSQLLKEDIDNGLKVQFDKIIDQSSNPFVKDVLSSGIKRYINDFKSKYMPSITVLNKKDDEDEDEYSEGRRYS